MGYVTTVFCSDWARPCDILGWVHDDSDNDRCPYKVVLNAPFQMADPYFATRERATKAIYMVAVQTGRITPELADGRAH